MRKNEPFIYEKKNNIFTPCTFRFYRKSNLFTDSIYVLGIYNSFILKLIDTIYRIQDLRIKEKPLPENLLLYIENKFNYYLEELCNEFPNTNFINLAFYNITCGKLDFYPSREGNISIGKIITKKIYKKIRKFLKRKI